MVNQLSVEQLNLAPWTTSPAPAPVMAVPVDRSYQAALETPQHVQSLLQPIWSDLRRVEQKMKSVEYSVFAPLADAFVDLIGSGGKRLRPALALLAANLDANPEEGSERHQSLIALSAAVEMLHTATLVHDDVIDGALLRRGAPTLNASWNAGATVLAGDYMFARAALFSAQTGNVRVINLFSETLKIIVDGELRQLFARHDFNQEWENYYQRIYAKTASLFSAATESAAILMGLNESEIQQLSSFGYNFGMAFQIVDDILDFTSDDRTLGKPAGSDLRQGTLTLPFLYHLRGEADPYQTVERLTEARAAAQEDDQGQLEQTVAKIVAEIRQGDGIALAQQEAITFLHKAASALSHFPDNRYRRSLLGLCAFVVQRSH